jgi:hypothetical protein
MVVVFAALALVAVLILIAATMPGPTAEGLTQESPVNTKKAGMRLRFGEPVIDVKKAEGDPFAEKEVEKRGSSKGAPSSTSSDAILSFTEYVFTVDSNGMRKAIESISPALVECYRQWQSLDDNVGVGVWDASFYFSQSPKLEETRRVRDIRLKHSSPDTEVMEQCLLEMFGMLRFEAKGPKKFTHPLVFDVQRNP